MQRVEPRAHRQLGTLGGGNHFVEVCLEQAGAEPGRVWLMLHSGSRNIGKELAERHIATARPAPQRRPARPRPGGVRRRRYPEMAAYRHDLWWAQEYARRNRAVMLALLCGVVRQALPQVRFDELISCHHNYVAEETYGDVELLVTRKGVIRAGRGDLGIIPGSMGTGSTSCAVGAARTPTARPRTVPAGGCHAPPPGARSVGRTCSTGPRAWSAARTPG